MLADNKNLFASTELVSRELTLLDGTKSTFWFKELTASQFRRYVLIENNGTFDEQASNVANLIHLSLVDEKGEIALTFEQAERLKPAVAVLFFNAILEINVVKKKELVEVDGDNKGKSEAES